MGERFVSRNNDGSVTMFCDNLPASGFIDAIKTRDICKIRVMTRQEKSSMPNGSPDVSVNSITGEKYMISRVQLINNFRFISGRKLMMILMHEGTVYTVQRTCNELYKAIKIPSNCNGIFKGRDIGNGGYLICRALQDGTPDMTTMSTISASDFRKVFRIPMQDIIQRYRGQHKKNTEFGLFNKRRARSKLTKNNISGTGRGTPKDELGTALNSIFPQNTQPKPQAQRQQHVNIQKPPVNNGQSLRDKLRNPNAAKLNLNKLGTTGQTTTEPKARFAVTHKVLRQQDSKLIGFMVKDNQSNKNEFATTDKMMHMCECRVVSNIMIVTHPTTGAKYLRGNGIQISQLPAVFK